MNDFRIKLTKKTDKNGRDYYFTVANIPIMVDLSDTAMLFFPRSEGGPELVIKFYEERPKRRAKTEE